MIGIYAIVNKLNNKVYVGQSINIRSRLTKHKWELNKNIHHNPHLQYAWNKYGEDCFDFITLCETTEEKLDEMEQYYIFAFDACDEEFGYNKSYGGKSPKVTNDVKQRMSVAHSGVNNPMYGKHHSDETKRKISEANKGRVEPDELRKKKSEMMSGEGNPMYGVPSPMTGKHHTEEARQKIRDCQIGEKNSFYGKRHSEETKKKLSEANSGKNNSRSKPVIQLTLDYEFIKEWDSCNQVKRETNGEFDTANISNCCNNKYSKKGNNIYKKYRWMFKEDYDKLRKLIEKDGE